VAPLLALALPPRVLPACRALLPWLHCRPRALRQVSTCAGAAAGKAVSDEAPLAHGTQRV
jgi:hypothetical protein